MRKIKKSLSLFLALTLFVCSFNVCGINALADIKEAGLSALTGISNLVNGISMTNEQSGCEHDYALDSIQGGNPSCTSSGSLVYKCTLCGAYQYRYEPLGHYYTYLSDDLGQFEFVCTYCNDRKSASIWDLYDIFQPNINKKPVRSNDNCMLDLTGDGIINAKDFAILKKGEAKVTPTTLTNKKSTEKTKQIYRYLCATYKNKTLSAQQESTWMGSYDYEIDYVYNNTGKYPAMRGLDYMNDDFNGVNSRAIEWASRGGIVTICWHTGSDFTGEWNDAMNDTVSNWNAMLTPGTNEYNQMIAGMDKAAQALLELQRNGVTVLWRPFHEFDGAWFWWGKGGAQNFRKLWQIMYDRYTNYWGLNNLIWVLGYSHNGQYLSSWNPGADYYDIIGADTYDTSEFATLYRKVTAIAPQGKPVVLHECGKNPTPSLLTSYPYAYFMTWHTTYITDDNDTSALYTLYNSDRIITLDEIDYANY